MNTISLYDTARRALVPFTPSDPQRVTMYVCGPTVYGPAHIGNFRPAVVFDVLFRLLRHHYGAEHVFYARNFTDVDDKINAAAAAEGVDISVITDRFTAIYHADSEALGIMRPTLEPTATGHMDEMIAMISGLIASGHAYEAEGHVLFSVKSYEAYGRLSNRTLDDMIAGARVEVAPYKKDPADFVLWKPSKPGEPVWQAPFGAGRPGWHIECSAMIAANLGETIDIHGGGIDLVFPHHENEVAQSACAHGKPLARYWLHNGFLSMDAEKMSKSLGNIIRPSELIARGLKGEVIRYALLTAHYRAPLDWTDRLIEQSRKSLDRLYGVLRRLRDVEAASVPPPAGVVAALGDDLNTAKALAALFEVLLRANKAETEADKAAAKGELLASGLLLGLLQADPDEWFGLSDLGIMESNNLNNLIIQRNQQKAIQNWSSADRTRKIIESNWFNIEDTEFGSVVSAAYDFQRAQDIAIAFIRNEFLPRSTPAEIITKSGAHKIVVDSRVQDKSLYVFDDNPYWNRDDLAKIISLKITTLKEQGVTFDKYVHCIYGSFRSNDNLRDQMTAVSEPELEGLVVVRSDRADFVPRMSG